MTSTATVDALVRAPVLPLPTADQQMKAAIAEWRIARAERRLHFARRDLASASGQPFEVDTDAPERLYAGVERAEQAMLKVDDGLSPGVAGELLEIVLEILQGREVDEHDADSCGPVVPLLLKVRDALEDAASGAALPARGGRR